MGRLDPAPMELCDEAMKKRESWPTLEKYMAMFDGLPELTRKEEGAFDNITYLS